MSSTPLSILRDGYTPRRAILRSPAWSCTYSCGRICSRPRKAISVPSPILYRHTVMRVCPGARSQACNFRRVASLRFSGPPGPWPSGAARQEDRVHQVPHPHHTLTLRASGPWAGLPSALPGRWAAYAHRTPHHHTLTVRASLALGRAASALFIHPGAHKFTGRHPAPRSAINRVPLLRGSSLLRTPSGPGRADRVLWNRPRSCARWYRLAGSMLPRGGPPSAATSTARAWPCLTARP